MARLFVAMSLPFKQLVSFIPFMKKEGGREGGEEEISFGLTIKQTIFVLYINFIILQMRNF